MSYHGVVNIIRTVAQAINPDGFFQHGRTWDASLNFDEGNPQIYLYPLQNSIDESNHYYETWSVVMGFYIQDTQDSLPAEREEIIKNADILQRQFTTALNQIEGIEVSAIRTEPKYRQMAGTYSGVLLNFTLGSTTNICGDEAEVVIIEPETLCDKIDTCLNIDRENGNEAAFLTNKGTYAVPETETSWGEITGNLSEQTDLQNALNAKEDTANKATLMWGNISSNSIYLTAKAVHDWATATFQTVISAASWGAFINGLSVKTTIADSDGITIGDSITELAKKVSFSTLKNEIYLYVQSQLNLTTRITHFDDFINGIPTQTQGSTVTYNTDSYTLVKPSSSGLSHPSFSGRPGIIQWDSTLNSSTQGHYIYNIPNLSINANLASATVEWCINPIQLSGLTAVDKFYTLRIGFIGTVSNSNVDGPGCYFRYTHSINSGRWECVNHNGTTETATDSGIPVVANNWVKLKVTVTPTEARFYIDGILKQTNTTNIPSSLLYIGNFFCIHTNSSFVTKSIAMDYYSYDIILTNSR